MSNSGRSLQVEGLVFAEVCRHNIVPFMLISPISDTSETTIAKTYSISPKVSVEIKLSRIRTESRALQVLRNYESLQHIPVVWFASAPQSSCCILFPKIRKELPSRFGALRLGGTA